MAEATHLRAQILNLHRLGIEDCYRLDTRKDDILGFYVPLEHALQW